MGGLRVGPDVELRGGGVKDLEAAPHKDDLPDLFRNAGLQAQGHADVGEGAGGDEGDIPLRLHQGVNKPPNAVLRLLPAYRGRHGQAIVVVGDDLPLLVQLVRLDAGHAGVVPVAVGQELGYHGGGTAPVDRGAAAEHIHHPQGVVGGEAYLLVSRHGAYPQQVNLGGEDSHHNGNGVIGAGVAVQNHFHFVRHVDSPSCLMGKPSVSWMAVERRLARMLFWLFQLRESQVSPLTSSPA